MRTLRSFIVVLGFLFLIPAFSMAGINENLLHFYARMGGALNATPAGAYEGQMSGHYTLGSFSARASASTTHVASMSAPSLRGGCGGIDAHMGSLSFVRSAHLKRMLQNITTSGMNYAFMIGFEQLCPMCKKTMDQLNKLAQEINQWNINACNTAASVMGGVLPRTQAVQNYVCSNYGANSGILGDYAASRQGCGAEGRSAEVLAHARTANTEQAQVWQDVLTDSGNLAWMILNKQALFTAETAALNGSGTELQELMMTLSGSIIVRSVGEVQRVDYLVSKASDRALLNALMYGGADHPAKIYQCNDTAIQGCLAPTYTKNVTILEQHSFVGRVKRLLSSIQRKLRSRGEETPLSAEERELINKTKSVPLVKAMNVQSAFSFASEIINIEDYAELIARDLLEDYLLELLEVVRIGAHKIEVDEAKLQQFMNGLREARERLLYIKMKDTQHLSQALTLVQKIQALEKLLAGEFSADMARTLDWAVGRR